MLIILLLSHWRIFFVLQTCIKNFEHYITLQWNRKLLSQKGFAYIHIHTYICWAYCRKALLSKIIRLLVYIFVYVFRFKTYLLCISIGYIIYHSSKLSFAPITVHIWYLIYIWKKKKNCFSNRFLVGMVFGSFHFTFGIHFCVLCQKVSQVLCSLTSNHTHFANFL